MQGLSYGIIFLQNLRNQPRLRQQSIKTRSKKVISTPNRTFSDINDMDMYENNGEIVISDYKKFCKRK